MIHAQTRFLIARVPLAQIVISTVEPRYEQRILAYVERLRADPTDEVNVALGVRGVDASGRLYFYVQDGRHRTIASLIVGRAYVIGLIHFEPGDPGYENALPMRDLSAYLTADTDTTFLLEKVAA